MAEEISSDRVQGWSPKRRAALVLRILKGETSVQEAARKCGLTVAEVEEWKDRFLVAATDATRGSSPEGEGRYRHVLENVRAIIVETDSRGRFTYVSPTITEVLGYPPEELVNRRGLEGIHEEDRAAVAKLFRKLITSGRGTKLVYRARHKNGHWVWLETTLSSYRTVDGSTYTVALARDVTEVKRAEEALRESEALYRTLAENASDLIAEVDGDGRFRFVSPNCFAMLGYRASDLIGRTLHESGVVENIHPDDRETLLEAFQGGIATGDDGGQIEFRYRHADGTWRWFDSKAKTYRTSEGALRAVVISRDVTERVRAQRELRQLEERMRQAQKLESLGVLAGGIAHDFNNLLTPILGEASLALMDLAPGSPARRGLQNIQRAGHRAAALTNQMLAYAGKRPLLVEPLNLSQLVREMAQLVESATAGKPVLAYDLLEDLPAVEADAAQLSQVVMNLITNASEAVGDGHGRITLRTGTVDADRVALAQTYLGDDLEGGIYVYVEVADTGCGMDAETRARIFDPFFTTKFTGRGLGLAAVLGIVRGHKGAIEIESEPGRGTRFRVLFPRSTRPPALGPSEPVDVQEWRGSGVVLVVEDDDGVREFIEVTLKRCGLSVLCAADGREGIELFRRHRDEIRVVLLDRTMPTTSGEEAFDEMRRIRPDARIILVSGYSGEKATEHFAGKGLAGFLQKPFLPQTLLQKVRALLKE